MAGRAPTIVRRDVLLVLLATVSGALAGVACAGFVAALEWATRTRVEHGWLVWLLPAAGLAIGCLYYYVGEHANDGTPLVVSQAHRLDSGVPARVAPLIFVATVAGHLFGASIAREGAGLQIAGSITDTGARALRLRDSDRQSLLEAALAGGFGAVFGVPFAGVAFAVQLAPRRRAITLVSSIAAAFTGDAVATWLGRARPDYPHVASVPVTLRVVVALAGAGVACGLLGRGFVWIVHEVHHRLGAIVRWRPARTVIGGAATIALVPLVGRDYLGLSLPVIGRALDGRHISPWVPLLKLAFTAIALGSGFVGGEVTALFLIGAAASAAIAAAAHAPPTLVAAAGFAAVFSSAATVTWTGAVMCVELFGWPVAVPALAVGAVARVVAGRPGLYLRREFVPTKRPPLAALRGRLDVTRRRSVRSSRPADAAPEEDN